MSSGSLLGESYKMLPIDKIAAIAESAFEEKQFISNKQASL